MRRLPMISFLFLVLCATTVVAQSANAAGTWDATLTSPQGTFNVQLILKQDGEKLSGVVKSPRGETPIEGTTNGKDIKLKYTIKFQDNDMLITLTSPTVSSTPSGRVTPAQPQKLQRTRLRRATKLILAAPGSFR